MTPSAADGAHRSTEVRPIGEESRHATRRSRWTHRLGDATTHSNASIGALLAMVAWIALGAAFDFPGWWSTTLFVATSAATLVMVFIVQHTQTRMEVATQRKLDELLRALPDADKQLIAAEAASDDELADIAQHHLAARRSATGTEDGPDAA
jgi:low affinity Fe/Cu permease